MHVANIDTGILLAIIPLALIDLAMVIYSIVDLFKPDRRVKGDNKLIWLLVILLVSTFGWLAYLLVRGFFSRSPGQVAIGLVLLFLYGGVLWGVLPGQPGISASTDSKHR